MTNFVDVGGPQFNPNPRGNQQGTLFSNKRLNKANRTGEEVGHKGYSPNRLNAVRQALDVKIAPGGKALSGRGAKAGVAYVRSEQAKGNKPPYPDKENDPTIKGRQIARKVMTQDIHHEVARSTMPGEHIESITPTKVKVKKLDRPGASGSFEMTDSDTAHGTIELNAEYHATPAATSTMMHEIGHAVDFATHAERHGIPRTQEAADRPIEPIPGTMSGHALSTASGSTPVRAARMEGFADAYTDVHTPPDVHQGLNTSAYPQLSNAGWQQYGGGRVRPGQDPAAEYAASRKLHGGIDIMRKEQFHHHEPRLPGFE